MVTAVIAAAGSGVRMGPGPRKQYATLAGRPVAAHALRAFDASPEVDCLILVVPANDVDFCQGKIIGARSWEKKIVLVPGGTHRGESVKNGLDAAPDETRIVLIHDGVRPFVTPDLIAACIQGAREHGAVIAAAPAFDTLKECDEKGRITRTLDRDRVWMAQTPQAFQYALLKEAHERAEREGHAATDDAMLVERLGHPVYVVPSSTRNMKITTPGDLAMARALFEAGKGGGK